MPRLNRCFYSDHIKDFNTRPETQILGILSSQNQYEQETTQRDAWIAEIKILKSVLSSFKEGILFFEFTIPRMGSRIDVLLIIKNVLFVLEFKVGEKSFPLYAIDQVWDYALDLKNFHKTSHDKFIAPVLISTEARVDTVLDQITQHNDQLLNPIKTNAENLRNVIDKVLAFSGQSDIDIYTWIEGRYAPTPTIIEAATALYNEHTVEEITRREAGDSNLTSTAETINSVIEEAKRYNKKSICFVTGVPGAGKTLVGLDIATKNMDKDNATTSVFLSGNGPLVAILREALTRDKLKREKNKGIKVKKGEVFQQVKSFIQNVHHFRDEYLRDDKAPVDHIAIFDEAQRAWNREQTKGFMKRKKNVHDFAMSEPEFLIECMDRHPDWAVIICLVGGGQEINTGEAGIGEWLDSIHRSFPNWDIYISPHLSDSEYNTTDIIEKVQLRSKVTLDESLHLSVSMRSFRAEHLSAFIKFVLDQDIEKALYHFGLIRDRYPIVLSRDLTKAKKWLKEKARGSERYGIVVSSQAQRLKPYAIDIRTPIDPVHWFLDGKDDVRSSYYLEDVATEFHVQGLELDWACVTWDGDYRYKGGGTWETFSFKGNKWQQIKNEERKQYLKNAYRVLLTRARQGMVIVVPQGDEEDHTRPPSFYNPTFNYLKSLGLKTI
jgi:DUF2075 family protein